MADSNYLTFRCPNPLREILNQLAEADDRSVSWEVVAAVRLYANHRLVAGQEAQHAIDASRIAP